MWGGCTDGSFDHEYINEAPVPVPVYFIVDGTCSVQCVSVKTANMKIKSNATKSKQIILCVLP